MNTETSKEPSAGLAVASLVLGIFALLLSPFLIGALFGFIGAVLGVIQLYRAKLSRTMAIWGLILSLLGIFAAGGFTFAYFQLFHWMKSDRAQSRENINPLDTWKGQTVPDVTLTTLDGQTIQLSQHKGKRIILDFWATWCPPCRKEIPHFTQLTGEISTNELLIIGISNEDPSELQTFIQQESINYPIVSTDDLPEPFSKIKSIPTTFFIDRNGIIHDILIGYHDYDTLKKTTLAED